jgi:hypothetical protein
MTSAKSVQNKLVQNECKTKLNKRKIKTKLKINMYKIKSELRKQKLIHNPNFTLRK